jgi:hypothetical protein
MADVLVFDPAEFEILETFDFEEDIQRPEQTRFYTLDEQLVDFFDKMMPKRKITKFEIKELKQYRDRVKEAYQNLVIVTETDYVIDRSRKVVNTSWIHPVYSSFDYKSYSYKQNWIPLFKEQRKNVNYYPRLIKALPSPYSSTSDGRMFDKSAMLVNEEGENPINGLGNFLMTRGVINDDGTISIEPLEVANTADNLKTIGYYLDKRPYELPRPMMEHPFLKSNQPHFVKTDVSLVDAYPSINAILEHAVPVTTDPYGEGKQYLKLYDVKLSQIPWSVWKERFPGVERRDVAPPVTELKFPKGNEDKPGDILIKTYIKEWHPGYDSRLWLSLQTDGGRFISKILLSEADVKGNLAPYPYSDATDTYLETNPEICLNLSENFNAFLDSGLYRQTFKKKGDFYDVKGVCVPISTIIQEKSGLIYKDRQLWKESTKHSILTDYQKLLKSFQIPIIAEEIKYEKVDHRTISERRKDILAILDDPEREPEDKADDIERIVRDLTLDKNQYYDLADQFVVCAHTLEILRGGMGDRFAFYAKWTVSAEGARVCRFCGEQVNKDIFFAVKEYDEDGHITTDYEALHETKPLTISVADIKKLFNFENAGESLMFTILTILQVTPEELQLLPVLQLIRKLTTSLRSKAKTITIENQELIEGVIGIAGAVVVLQTHTPFLIPKRGIGNKPLNMGGYPRDSDNPEECFILGSIFSVLRKTLESVPASFKGGIATGLRAILKNSKEVKEQSLRWIKVFYDQFNTLFETARERYEEPDEEIITNTLQLPILPIEKADYSPGESLVDEERMGCNLATIVWSIKAPPNVRQLEPQLQEKIYPSPDLSLVVGRSSSIPFASISDKDIRRSVGLGLPAGFPLADFVKNADAASYVVISSRILSILSSTSFSVKEQRRFRQLLVGLDIRESTSLLRDTAKGIFFELMSLVKASAPLTRLVNDSLKTDLTFRMLLLSEDAANKEDFELRSRERNFLKAALRSMNDTEREITQRLLELGIADVLISNADRERFAREFSWIEVEENVVDPNRPEEGYAGDRDYVENGDQPIADDGTQLEVDRGFYGDRAVRDYDDYTPQTIFNDDDTL